MATHAVLVSTSGSARSEGAVGAASCRRTSCQAYSKERLPFAIPWRAMAVVNCSQCGAELPLQAELRFFLGDRRMCNFKCMHDAGSRARCGPGCGCRAYAIKRRMLREHRELLRCMEVIIAENGLYEDLDVLWQNNRPPRPGREQGYFRV